jgi:hypothetical protein
MKRAVVIILLFTFGSVLPFQTTNAMPNVNLDYTKTTISIYETVNFTAQVSYSANITWFCDDVNVQSEFSTSSNYTFMPKAVGVYYFKLYVDGFTNPPPMGPTKVTVTEYADPVPISLKPFSYSELSCQAHINSPIKNFTYSASDFAINVWLYIGGTEKEPNAHYIPYQDISCLYSLDGAEWQNMTLLSAVKSELFPSIPNNYWYSNMRINFTATLIDVSRGEHDLQFSVKPDSIHTRFIVESDNDYAAIPKSIDYINFRVAQNSNESPTNTDPVKRYLLQ